MPRGSADTSTSRSPSNARTRTSNHGPDPRTTTRFLRKSARPAARSGATKHASTLFAIDFMRAPIAKAVPRSRSNDFAGLRRAGGGTGQKGPPRDHPGLTLSEQLAEEAGDGDVERGVARLAEHRLDLP